MSDHLKRIENLPASIRFPFAEAKCKELMTEEEYVLMFLDYESGQLLRYMEDWLAKRGISVVDYLEDSDE